jgi:hypothetical protein
LTVCRSHRWQRKLRREDPDERLQAEWTNKSGAYTAWIVTYFDRDGSKRQETFDRERDAKAPEAEVRVNVAKGVHTPRSVSPTVAEVGGF